MMHLEETSSKKGPGRTAEWGLPGPSHLMGSPRSTQLRAGISGTNTAALRGQEAPGHLVGVVLLPAPAAQVLPCPMGFLLPCPKLPEPLEAKQWWGVCEECQEQDGGVCFLPVH